MTLAVGMKEPQTIDHAREILETYFSLKDESKGAYKVRNVQQKQDDVKLATQSQLKEAKNEIQQTIHAKFDEIMSVVRKLEAKFSDKNKDASVRFQPRERGSPNGFKLRDLSTVECYRCRSMGHYANTCPNAENWDVCEGN